jgi:hypothetical protein
MIAGTLNVGFIKFLKPVGLLIYSLKPQYRCLSNLMNFVVAWRSGSVTTLNRITDKSVNSISKMTDFDADMFRGVQSQSFLKFQVV